MPVGGRRPGAGRPKGSLNKTTAETLERIKQSGELPLDYMLRVMRDERADKARRDDMAKAASPYVHARLQAVDATLKANIDGSVTFTWLPPVDDDPKTIDAVQHLPLVSGKTDASH